MESIFHRLSYPQQIIPEDSIASPNNALKRSKKLRKKNRKNIEKNYKQSGIKTTRKKLKSGKSNIENRIGIKETRQTADTHKTIEKK